MTITDHLPKTLEWNETLQRNTKEILGCTNLFPSATILWLRMYCLASRIAAGLEPEIEHELKGKGLW